MKHIDYGHIPNVYEDKRFGLYYVQFTRFKQRFFAGYYKTIEEAIQVRNQMQRFLPKIKRKECRKAKVDMSTTWYLKDYLKDEAPEITQNRIIRQ